MANRTEVSAKLVSKVEGLGVKVSKKDMETIVKAYEDVIKDFLVDGEKVDLTGFLQFGVKDVEAGEKRNPATGKPVSVPAHKEVTVKKMKNLKECLK